MEKQKKIGILCASDTELKPFLKHIQSPQITRKSNAEILLWAHSAG